MNDTWDLSILYKDFDDPAFTGDMAALDQAIAAVNALAGEAADMDHSSWCIASCRCRSRWRS